MQFFTFIIGRFKNWYSVSVIVESWNCNSGYYCIMVTTGEISVVHFNYEFTLLYVLIARVLIYKIVGPGDHSDVARVRHILHVINFNDIGAQFSTSSEYNWCTKEKIDSDVRCTKFEHSILVHFSISKGISTLCPYIFWKARRCAKDLVAWCKFCCCKRNMAEKMWIRVSE